MLNSMEKEITTKNAPTVTDLTIVVIEPKHLEHRNVVSFTNNQITQIPIVRPTLSRINCRDDCTIDSHVSISARIREYWQIRGQQAQSLASSKIMNDFNRLVRWP